MIQLRDYQIDISDKASQSLRDHKIAYLCCETRTGKTIIAMETIKKYGAKNVLFVTKLKAIPSIVSDYQSYVNDFECTVINYDSLHKVQGSFDLVVCDESHSLSAFPKQSKRVKDIKRLTLGLPIIYLSATPSPESFSQLYHQFYISSFSPFAQYKNFYHWAKVFVDVKVQYLYGRTVNDYSGARIKDIEPFVKHLFFSQTQVDSGFENRIEESVIYVPMSEGQKILINRINKDGVFTGRTGATILADTAVKKMSKIHQICSGTVKDEAGIGHVLTSAKAEKIKEMFAGKKIAVFYHFVAEFEMLKAVFPNWTAIPEEFQADNEKTFLGQFVSSREGVRLDTAFAIIFINIPYSFLSYEQGRNRIVSKERTEKARLYWVFAEDGIEEKIYKVLKSKKDYTSFHYKKDFHVGVKVPKQANQAVYKSRVVRGEAHTDESKRHCRPATYSQCTITLPGT